MEGISGVDKGKGRQAVERALQQTVSGATDKAPGTSPAFLFLLNSLEIGGSERKAVRVVNALQGRGWPVHLAYLKEPHTLLDQLDDRVPRLYTGRRRKVDLASFRTLGAYVEAHEIRHLFCMNPYPMLYAYSLARKSRNALQYSVFINTTDHYSAWETFKMKLYRPLLRAAHRVVFGCRHQLELWVERYRLDPSRCTFIYNGVDSDWFSPKAIHKDFRRELSIGKDQVVIGMIGQLRRKKQYPDLIEATRRLREQGMQVTTVIVGDGPERDSLVRCVRQMGLTGHVRFVGEQADVRPALQTFDVFALTSTASETFSNAALEAMASAKPVVMSRIGGAAEMVSDGETGFLYPPGEVSGLVAALAALVRDPELRLRVGREARNSVVGRFGFNSMVDQYERLLPGAP